MNKPLILILVAFIVGGLIGAGLMNYYGACRTQTKKMILQIKTPGANNGGSLSVTD